MLGPLSPPVLIRFTTALPSSTAKQISDVEKVRMVFRDGIGFDPAKLIESVRGQVGLH